MSSFSFICLWETNLYCHYSPIGCVIFNPDVQQYRDSNLCLLKHTMKIINIYYHLFTNQKPLIMAKGQKMDLFSNTKELAITQSIGYFGSEYIYMKLYQNLKSAYDNYRVSKRLKNLTYFFRTYNVSSIST